MSNALTSAWRRYRSLPPLQREFVTFALMLLVALTLLPLAIWSAGQVFLGDYLRDPGDPAAARHGGPLALFGDYLAGIFNGSPGYWFVLLGPYLLLLVFRLGCRLAKR